MHYFIPWLLDVGLRLHHRHGLGHDETLADFHHIPVELERVGQDTRVGGLDILTEEGGDRAGQQLSVEESGVHVPCLHQHRGDVVAAHIRFSCILVVFTRWIDNHDIDRT